MIKHFAIILIASIGLLLTACTKPGQLEFVLVVSDHDKITQETTTAIMQSVDAEMAKPTVTEAQKQILAKLKVRLKYLADSAEVMKEYVYSAFVDEEMMAKLIRARWDEARK